MTPNASPLAGTRQCFEGPDWRYGRALQLSLLPSFHPRGEIDPLIAQTADYLRLQASGAARTAKAQAKYPRVATAISWWDNPDNAYPFILLTLADCPREQIATRCGLDLPVVEAVEHLFLDIRDARGASSWIHSHVILPELRRGDVERATQYRAVFWGGTPMAESILDAGKVLLQEEVQRIIGVEQRLATKALAALELPLGKPADAVRFTKLYLDHQRQAEALAWRKQKFQARCELERRKLDLAERRQQAREQREAAQRQAVLERGERRRQQSQEHEQSAQLRRREAWSAAEQQSRRERAVQSPLAHLTWANPMTREGESAHQQHIETRARSSAAA